MKKNEVYLLVNNYVKYCLKREEDISYSDRLVEDLGLDSLEIVSMIVELEGKLADFEIRIDADEADKWRTVEDVINTVCRQY